MKVHVDITILAKVSNLKTNAFLSKPKATTFINLFMQFFMIDYLYVQISPFYQVTSHIG